MVKIPAQAAAAEIAQADRYLMQGAFTGRGQVMSFEGGPALECNDKERSSGIDIPPSECKPPIRVPATFL
jgi:hypothetical protein